MLVLTKPWVAGAGACALPLAGLFALAVITVTKGSISVIAVAAGSIILGIAVNYSLHYLTHHRFHPQAETVIKELAFPLTVGSLTTIAGFLCLQLVNVPVLQDLGMFAGLSLVGWAGWRRMRKNA